MILLLTAAAHAGEVVIDARLPTAISIDGTMFAELYLGGELHFELPDGPQQLTIHVAGGAHPRDIIVSPSVAARILVGKTGIDVLDGAAALPEFGSSQVAFRLQGDEGVVLVLDGVRHSVPVGTSPIIELPIGPHRLGVRSADSTVIWAEGTLDVDGGPATVHLAYGQLPETSGGVGFRPAGR